MGSTPARSELVPALEGSTLALSVVREAAAVSIAEPDGDTLVYVFHGSGSLETDSEAHPVAAGTAAFVASGDSASLVAGQDGVAAILATVGRETDLHAPLGPRAVTARLEEALSQQATGARSFQILFGPHNGSTRATLFAGFIPPGKAPWHYHLYDEIVWVPEGPGRLHIGDSTEELGPGSAFRLRPRQMHIVENLSPSAEMVVIGVFTPAGSPSAAYLAPDTAAEYRFAG